jgi:hypothetical protein
MRYWLLVLLVTGLVTVAGYALVQSLQTPQQTIGKEVQQTAERILEPHGNRGGYAGLHQGS